MTKGIRAKDIRAFEKASQRLVEVLVAIREYCPDAFLYATPNCINLMSGVVDEGVSSQDEQTDFLVSSVTIHGLEAGDW